MSWANQASYLNESEYMAWNFPEVKSTSQFLSLTTSPTRPSRQARSSTGARSRRAARARGSRKASFFSYPVPIWLPKTHVRARRSFLVWGMRRNAADGVPQQATVQYATLACM